MGVRHVGLVTGTGQFTLTPDRPRPAHAVRLGGVLSFPWWLGGRLGSVIAGRLVLPAVWKRNLRNLKRMVEATSANVSRSRRADRAAVSRRRGPRR